MQFGHLTYPEIKQAAAENWLVIIPTGCTEQQGIHLPVDIDTWLAESLCSAASEKASESFQTQSLVLPAVPFGPTPEHTGFGGGYIHLPQDLHEKVYREVLNSLTTQGFHRLMIWQGCGQHRLAGMTEQFLEHHPDVQIHCPELPYRRIWEDLVGAEVAGGHAASFPTSLALYLRPEDVRKERIRNPEYTMPDWSDPDLDLSTHTDTGTIGDLSAASAALGERLWNALVEACAVVIRDCCRLT